MLSEGLTHIMPVIMPVIQVSSFVFKFGSHSYALSCQCHNSLAMLAGFLFKFNLELRITIMMPVFENSIWQAILLDSLVTPALRAIRHSHGGKVTALT